MEKTSLQTTQNCLFCPRAPGSMRRQACGLFKNSPSVARFRPSRHIRSTVPHRSPISSQTRCLHVCECVWGLVASQARPEGDKLITLAVQPKALLIERATNHCKQRVRACCVQQQLAPGEGRPMGYSVAAFRLHDLGPAATPAAQHPTCPQS